MLELEVFPERSLGCESWEFVLGMHLSAAISIIHHQVEVLKGVELLYSDQNPLEVDIIIRLSNDGIKLIFDSRCQRLKVIEVYSMKKLKLKYSGMSFNTPEISPTIEQIDQSFGATHPGVYDAEKQLYSLHFRGLSFYFPVEAKYQPQYAHGLGSFQFPNGASPHVSKMRIYSGDDTNDVEAPLSPLCCYHNHVYLEQLEVIRENHLTHGVRLKVSCEGTQKVMDLKKQMLGHDIRFGESCQDVCSKIGSPQRIYYKAEDKMRIHSCSAFKTQAMKSDYFFNYFTLGLDILFDADTDTVKKFVLHTNYPGHYDFNMYHRCEFVLVVMPNKCLAPNSSPSASSSSSSTQTQIMSQEEGLKITALSKWDEIAHLLKPSQRPVVLNRTSTTNTTNPFGSTFCYGFEDIIFEVMPNGHLAAVTLYQV
ncbi:unnamed protein product [Darwinula stevensoni]|uniref:Uncharacterized protein n=1 Tax=Darwinula stevensoni TaxID=69355 RepID=A0A7R8X5M2_9CRUS|nr:unnamed protein product [Darwinula stevensoni]CAG0881077.1 unnamed protein product [Darwinula stevensoni]